MFSQFSFHLARFYHWNRSIFPSNLIAVSTGTWPKIRWTGFGIKRRNWKHSVYEKLLIWKETRSSEPKRTGSYDAVYLTYFWAEGYQQKVICSKILCSACTAMIATAYATSSKHFMRNSAPDRMFHCKIGCFAEWKKHSIFMELGVKCIRTQKWLRNTAFLRSFPNVRVVITFNVNRNRMLDVACGVLSQWADTPQWCAIRIPSVIGSGWCSCIFWIVKWE